MPLNTSNPHNPGYGRFPAFPRLPSTVYCLLIFSLLAFDFSLFLSASWALDEERFALLRRKMVESQIQARGIKDPKTLAALGRVPRHLFVPSELKDLAYEDRPLPIGWGQTISQPYIVALMTELLRLKGGEKVLEIGTGSAYQAAVLAQITDKVYTVEIYRTLGRQAQERLERLGYGKVAVKQGDGYYGWEEKGPFDAIMVTAAAGHIPPPLIAQLKEGGRLVIPVGAPFYTQNLMLLEKKGGEIHSSIITQVIFVPLIREHEKTKE